MRNHDTKQIFDGSSSAFFFPAHSALPLTFFQSVLHEVTLELIGGVMMTDTVTLTPSRYTGSMTNK